MKTNANDSPDSATNNLSIPSEERCGLKHYRYMSVYTGYEIAAQISEIFSESLTLFTWPCAICIGAYIFTHPEV